MTAKQVKRYFVEKESWFQVRNKPKDQRCGICNNKYTDLKDTHIGFASFEGLPNKHLCFNCCEAQIALGAQDLDKIVSNRNIIETEILSLINNENGYFSKKLKECTMVELETLRQKLLLEKEQKEELQRLILETYIETPTDEYLIKDYDIVEDTEYLKHESQFEEYFKDCGSEYFDCGQGYYDDEAEVYAKIGNRYFRVQISAEICSSKQDRGDRLYWVERISDVRWNEIEKPKPKPVRKYIIELEPAEYENIKPQLETIKHTLRIIK